jgi:hypothetical protein
MIGYVVMGLLAGCVTASQVSPIGPGLYVVTGHASGGLNAGKGVSAAAQTGNAFCTARHQVMAVDKTETHGMAAVGGESNTLTFRCVGP